MTKIALCCMSFLAVSIAAKAQADCSVPCGRTLCPGSRGFLGAVDASRTDDRPTFRVNRAFGSPPEEFGVGSELWDQSWLVYVQSANRILVLFPRRDSEDVLVQRVAADGDLLDDCRIPLEDAVSVSLSADCVGAASKKGLFPECHDTNGFCTAGSGSNGLFTLVFGSAAIALSRRFALRSRAPR